MGACSSTEAAPAHGPVKKKVDDTEIGKAYEQAGDELEAYINKREGFSKFLAVADTVPAEEQLLVSTIAMVIFSAELPTFRPWVEQKAGNANALSCSMSPSNVNFSSWMLRGMFAWSREIAEGKQPETDEAVSKSQLMSVLRLKLLWEKLLETSAVYSFTHPHLGKLALVQPLLMQAILHRGAGRGNGQGDQPDPVVGYFLDNGADVDAPNCLGITPLMLTIGALHTTLSSDSGPTDDVSYCHAVMLCYQHRFPPSLPLIPTPS